MATASVYDEYNDEDVAFTNDELEAYSPKIWASGRIDELVHLHQVIERALMVGISKPDFWDKVNRKLLDFATWYAMAVTVPSIDRSSVTVAGMDWNSAEGKALTVEAQALSAGDPQEWLEAFSSDAGRNMQYVVTIGRRCALKKSVTKWGKAERSLSNKLANAVLKEVTLVDKLQELLAARAK